MECRAIRKDEAPQLEDIQAHSFFFSYDKKEYMEKLETDDESWRCGRAVVDDGGKVVAGLDLLPYTVWFDGAAVGMGGIGGVASRVELRRGGNVRRLLALCMREMYDRGDVFSFLYPFSFPYYRQFGYEVCLTTRTITAPPDPLLVYARDGSGEQFLPGKGFSAIPDIYEAFAARHNLALRRNERQWKQVLDHDPAKSRRYTYVRRNAEGTPCAYVVLIVKKDFANELLVQEAAWLDRDAMLGLLGFLGRYGGNAAKIEWSVPGSFAPELFWGEAYDVETVYKHRGMNRIVNVQKALELVKKPLACGSVAIRVDDSFFPENTGVYAIEWDDGVHNVQRTDKAPDMDCPVQALTQLVVGYLPFEQIALRSDVHVHSQADTLSALFPAKPLFFGGSFLTCGMIGRGVFLCKYYPFLME